MQHFCTLFNSYYLSRGLALYRSLVGQAIDFHLYIIAFDDDCEEVLRQLNLSHATVISLRDFETPALLAVKADRTPGEYCWTCTSFTIWYCIHTFSLSHCTYLDADLLFFDDPALLTSEMGANSVLITEHRYSNEHDQSELSGIYCVQFVTFKNTTEGLTVLSWWMNACLNWCFARFEDGKFGDQKYLDDWTTRFTGIHVLQHRGGGIAPWNATDYTYETHLDKVMLTAENGKKTSLVFYHFHDFRYCAEQSFRLTAEQYTLHSDVKSVVYSAYLKALAEAENQIRAVQPLAVLHEPPMPLKWIKVSLSRRVQFLLKGHYKNYVGKSALI
jgi:hypothetical protein